MNDLSMNTAETPADFGAGGPAVVRRWLTELQLASKEEKDWREDGAKIYSKYRSKDRKKNAFNILYSNTETLRPAVYNSLPQPDVRRRFKDADPLGRCVSDTLMRALQFTFDTTRFDEQLKLDVLDMLLPGRGLSRVRYIPSLVQVGDSSESGRAQDETEESHEALQGPLEEVAWQQVCIEHVQWDDFRHGPGKTWDEVEWVAFRHRLTRQELEQQFGDKGARVPLTGAQAEDVKTLADDDPVKQLFATAEVWEVWHKPARQVLFLSDALRDSPIVTLDDPLRLTDFFPVPEPLRSIEDSASLVPTSLYAQYREQAEELDRISIRLNKIIDALKVRGIYDSTMGNDIAQLLRGSDNDLIPAEQVAAWIEKGGIEKAIWMMPIDVAMAVAAKLAEQREQTKQVIYDLTGIADVMRAQSDPNETYGAQKLKSQWGSIRLQRMQGQVQRYIRDLVRLLGELIAEHFTEDTLAQMTGLPYLTSAQAHAQQLQQQVQALMAQHMGQPAPPPQPPQPNWGDIVQLLRNDAMRTFKVDIETDSTIAAAMQQDMAELASTIDGVVKIVGELMPAVQGQMLPFEAAKELVLAVVRRARLGNAVEDAMDAMQAPPPQGPNPKVQEIQAKAQADQQSDQARAQTDLQIAQAKIQADAQADQARLHNDMLLEQFRQEMQARQVTQQNAIEAQREALQAHYANQQQQQQAAMEQMRAHIDGQIQLLIAAMNNRAKVEVAELANATTLASTQISAAAQGSE